MVRKQNKTKRRENELRRAREIITREYGDIKSPYKPLEYGIIYESIAYEISRLSPSEDRIFGVTMARERPDGTTQRLYTFCRFFDSEQKAKSYVLEMKRYFRKPEIAKEREMDLNMVEATASRGDIWILHIPKNLVDRLNELSIRGGNGEMFSTPAELEMYLYDQLEDLLYLN